MDPRAAVDCNVSAQCQFIKDFYGVKETGDWTGCRGVALLHQTPILIGNSPVEATNPFLVWFCLCAATDIRAAVNAAVRSERNNREILRPVEQVLDTLQEVAIKTAP